MSSTVARRASPDSRWAAASATAVVVGIAAAHVAVHLAFSARYGYHRDELYFLATARHLAWGFVDQPPLTPAVAWLAQALFGDSLVGLRLLPVLATGRAGHGRDLHGQLRRGRGDRSARWSQGPATSDQRS